MKLAKLAVGVLLCHLTVSANAWGGPSGIAGQWTGWGIWTYEGSGTNCQMKLAFAESSTEFKRLGGTFDCNIVALYSNPVTWSIRGNELFTGEEKAGEIGKDFVKVTEAVNDKARAVTTIRKTGDKFSYEEIWYDSPELKREIYHIEGNFKRR